MRPNYSRLFVGLFVIVLGVAFTLDNLHIVDVRRFWDVVGTYWPLLLVGIGAGNIYRAQTWSGYAGGLIWVVVGSWLQAESLGIVDVSIWALWPLALVAFGAWLLLCGLWPGRMASAGPASSGNTVGAVAVMSGVTRRSVATDFRGGDVVAFMGGATIDLRGADIASGEARLEVFVMWGGIDLLVPEGWAIDCRVFPFLGGVDDKTRKAAAPDAPRLVVRGLVVMGGMDIKHSRRSDTGVKA